MMGLFETAAAKALASSGVFLFMTVLLIAAAKRTSTCIALFSLQSLVLTAQIIAMSRMHHSTEGFVIAAMVLTVKVVAIPYALYRIVEELKAPRDVSSSTSSSQSVFIAAGLILLSFFAVRPYAGVLGGDQAMLAASVALVLTGGFLMISRKKALVFIAAALILLSFFAVRPYAGVLGGDQAMLAAKEGEKNE